MAGGNAHGRDHTAPALLNPPNQGSLFFETPSDALGSCIQAAGGFKRVAAQLWPSMKPESAYARLKACMDDGRHERLGLDEVLQVARLGRAAGCHAWAEFCAQELGYAPPVAVDPAEQRQQQLRTVVEGLAALQAAVARLTR